MKMKTRQAAAGLFFLLPFAAGFLLFYVIPFLWSVRYTFMRGAGGSDFAGLSNYRDLFASSAFRLAAWNTVRFIMVGVPLLMGVSLLLALLLQGRGKWEARFRPAFLYPMVVPVASVVTVVQAFFAGDGLINQFLRWIGMPAEDWLHSEHAFAVLVGLYIWKNCGYDLILFLAGLSAIPKDYREAAALEGAGRAQIFCRITAPLLLPSFFLILIISVINSFKSFREAYLLGGESPHDSIYMLQHFMNNNFQNLNYQRLSTAAVLIFGAVFALLLLLFAVRRSRPDGR